MAEFYIMTGHESGDLKDAHFVEEVNKYVKGVLSKPFGLPCLRKLAEGKRGCGAIVVDNDAVVLKAVSAGLQACGMKVFPYAGPAEALTAYPTIRPELVLTDYDMPGMTGFELIKRILETDGAQK